MSSTEEEVEVEPLPPHRIRFTDMPWALVDKAIRRKSIHTPTNLHFLIFRSGREGNSQVQNRQRFGDGDSNAD